MADRPEPTRWLSTASAGGPWCAPGYLFGFHEAVEVLIASARGTPMRDVLIYPILFTLRHFAELVLKALILEAERAVDWAEKMGWLLGARPAPVGDDLARTHNLGRLLSWLRERLAVLTEEELPEEWRQAVEDLNRLDPTGQVFRHPHTRSGDLQIPDATRFDLDEVQRQCRAINSLLHGVDGVLSEIIDAGPRPEELEP